MILYTYSKAPSPQRVEYFMREKGIALNTQQVNMMKGEHLSADYKQKNPRATLPALILDDGTVISEVVAICRYLEVTYENTPALLGIDAQQQAVICEWDHRIEFELLSAVADALRNTHTVYKNRALPGALDLEQIPELVPRGLKRIKAFFEILDKQLSVHPFVAGDHFSFADITAFVGINFSAWVKVTVPEELTHLHRWLTDMSERPSLK